MPSNTTTCACAFALPALPSDAAIEQYRDELEGLYTEALQRAADIRQCRDNATAVELAGALCRCISAALPRSAAQITYVVSGFRLGLECRGYTLGAGIGGIVLAELGLLGYVGLRVEGGRYLATWARAAR